jgi:CBS domain-containing protein
MSSLLDDYVFVYHDGCYPVISNGSLRGLISPVDLQKFPRSEWREHSVSEAMTPSERLQVAQASDDLAQAVEIMASADVQQLPVMDNGRFVGFLARSDVMRLVQIRREVGRTQRPEGRGRGIEVGHGTKGW